MSEVVEKVAQAIEAYKKAHQDSENGDQWWTYDDLARAAIKAMREPDEAMLSVEKPMCHLGDGPPYYTGGHNWLLRADKDMWQAMIDEALK